MLSFISNGITFRITFPAYPISLFVDHFVSMEGTSSGKEERLFPNNKSEIFFNLGDRLSGYTCASSELFHLKGSVVSGTRHTYFSFQPGTRFAMIGLRFTLFGFQLLFGIPAYHFTDQNLDASDVWGKEMDRVYEQLLESEDSAGHLDILYRWIEAKIQGLSFQDVVKWKKVEGLLLQEQISVAHFLEKTLGYSHKHSIRLIKEKSGLTPKIIQNVNRFDRALRMLNHQPSVDWPSLALDAGYADQSHFIREFRRYTGYTPATYLEDKPRSFQFYKQLETLATPEG